MTRRSLTWLPLASAVLFFTSTTLAGDWLQWRGPQGTGQADEKSAPLTWSKTEDVKWKVTLDGPGNSSPIVVGQRVFVRQAPAMGTLRGIRGYDRDWGKLLWTHQIEYSEPEGRYQNTP